MVWGLLLTNLGVGVLHPLRHGRSPPLILRMLKRLLHLIPLLRSAIDSNLLMLRIIDDPHFLTSPIPLASLGITRAICKHAIDRSQQ